MSLTAFFIAAALGLLSPGTPAPGAPQHAAKPARLFSPLLHVHPGSPGSPHVALTFDACTGQTDQRILSALIDHRIKATIFVTARWLKRNPAAMAQMLDHRDLFQIENHGARHVSAIDVPAHYFGVQSAGSAAAIRQEVLDGATAIEQATGRRPTWYRGAVAEYNAGGLAAIRSTGFRLAGYSHSGDQGAGLSAARAAAAVASAVNGDVVIAHLNQPLRPAGAGVVEGILALKAKGFVFVRLDERHIAH